MTTPHALDISISIRVTEDVRNWINELCQIFGENLQRSVTQGEVIRWMCTETIGPANKLYSENYWRIRGTERKTTEPLDTERLYSAVSAMRDEELARRLKFKHIGKSSPGVIFEAAKMRGIKTEGKNEEEVRILLKKKLGGKNYLRSID